MVFWGFVATNAEESHITLELISEHGGVLGSAPASSVVGYTDRIRAWFKIPIVLDGVIASGRVRFYGTVVTQMPAISGEVSDDDRGNYMQVDKLAVRYGDRVECDYLDMRVTL
jgi:hypothetical protein